LSSAPKPAFTSILLFSDNVTPLVQAKLGGYGRSAVNPDDIFVRAQ